MDNVLPACFLSVGSSAAPNLHGRDLGLTSPPRPTTAQSARLGEQRAHTIKDTQTPPSPALFLSLYITGLIEKVQSMARQMIQVTRTGARAQRKDRQRHLVEPRPRKRAKGQDRRSALSLFGSSGSSGHTSSLLATGLLGQSGLAWALAARDDRSAGNGGLGGDREGVASVSNDVRFSLCDILSMQPPGSPLLLVIQCHLDFDERADS